jgi:hypothetical protein
MKKGRPQPGEDIRPLVESDIPITHRLRQFQHSAKSGSRKKATVPNFPEFRHSFISKARLCRDHVQDYACDVSSNAYRVVLPITEIGNALVALRIAQYAAYRS